jgi:hydroxyacylglutathione hydrolase
MYLKQFYLASLGHASYLLGDERTGQAMVVDPRRDVDGYFAAARARELRIAYAIDTHGHNDYLSGLGELAARQPLQLLGLVGAELGYAHRPVKDREQLEFGDLAVEVLHTPGHTPEHVSLLVHDRTAGEDPALLLSGGAEVFCHTIQNTLLTLPDHVEVFPTHVAGSLCGGNIGSRLSTTVGYERRTNAALARVDSSTEFVRECLRLDNLPALPPYWRRMRAQNLAGPPALGVLGEPSALQPEEFAERRQAGALVLDTRSPEAFAGGHIPGALSAGLGSSFATWAGTVLPADASVLLVLENPGDLWEATWQLLRIGYPPPAGWLAGGMRAWVVTAGTVATLAQLTVQQLRERRDEVIVLDVRQPAEWATGHIDGATWITGAELPDRIDEIPRGRPVAVVCSSGYRSTVAASLLAHHRTGPVANIPGGMTAWQVAGYPAT